HLAGGRVRTYVSLAHNVWGMGRGGKKGTRPVIFARLGAEEDLQPELVAGMRNALDKLLERLIARDAAKSGEAAASAEAAIVESVAAKVRAHEGGLRMLTSRELGVRRVVEAVWKRLGLDRVLEGFADQHRLAFAFERVVFAMVLNRLVDPAS